MSTRKFMSFAVIGVLGFLVDAAVLAWALALGSGHYVGRAVSWLAAATFTWFGNRTLTFRGDPDGATPLSQWARFLVANGAGGSVNLGVYWIAVSFSETVHAWPVLGVAAGSASGLLINYFLSARYVFSRG